MVDHENAYKTEREIFALLKDHPKCKKYKFSLHPVTKYGIDMVATAKQYEGLAVELESTQGLKWPSDAPYPITWKKGYSIPARKKKFFETHPLSIFVKVNGDKTRAFVAPMSYICSVDTSEYDNENAHHMKNNNFFMMQDPNHPATCCCPIGDLGDVVDAQLRAMQQMKKINEKYTDKRPEFNNKFTQAKNKEN